MSSLTITEVDGILVVDSRLIAEELGIQHKNFLATLSKYIDEIEEDWGQVAFQTETVTNSVGARNPVKFALLTEQQATLLMTYSKNTQQVRECKRQLVKAFEKAKQCLGNESRQRVMVLENKLEIALEAITALRSANAQLQSQVQKLLPPSADFTPPGWNQEVWQSLPPQDKQHFRFLYHQHGFIPSDQGIDPLEIPLFTTEQVKQRQREEFLQLVGEVSQEELERMEAIKREILQQFLAQEG